MLKKDRSRVGVMFTPANPPNMIEFLAAMQAIAEVKIDRFLYVVDCAHSGPPALSETTEHRCAMARAAAASFEPLITFTDLDGGHDLILERTSMANGKERLRADGEDYAFRIFRFNPKDRLTLVFLTGAEHCRRTDDCGRDDTINKLLLNIKQRYCGFNPDLHNVLCLFMDDPQHRPPNPVFDRDDQNLIDRNIFAIEFMDRTTLGGIPAGTKALARAMKDALEGRRNLALLPLSVYSYLEAHSDCKQRLIESLAD
ncbi:MAG: hypothetical protein ABSF66_16085 [Terriglobales bacterium]|jgi:hypothetical protein